MGRFIAYARQHWAMTAALVLCLGIVAFVFWAEVFSGEDPRIAAIRARGEPVTLMDLNEGYRLPPSGNAAGAYLKAFDSQLVNHTNPGQTLLDQDWLPQRGQFLNPEQMNAVETMLREDAEVFRTLHGVRPGTRARYPVDFTQGLNTLLPHLGKLKRTVSLLCVESLYHCGKGNPQQAIHSIVAASNLADSVRDEPTLVSQLVWMAAQGLVLSTI